MLPFDNTILRKFKLERWHGSDVEQTWDADALATEACIARLRKTKKSTF